MISKELHTLLQDTEVPFYKKIIIANNAYKCPELAVGHKEVFLLKWIIKHSHEDFQESWKCINNWLISTQFTKLNKNDINTEDFITIIELIQEKLLLMDIVDKSTKRTILDSIRLLIINDVFCHYFKYNVDVYCKLISSMLQKIDCFAYLQEFLRLDLFDKTILAHEKFHINFLGNILPSLIECLKKFDFTESFDYISKYVQKCVFYRNHKNFKIFIGNFFEAVKEEKNSKIPKYLLKYMLNTYRVNQDAILFYKIIFHAFCAAYCQDFELIYKFLILLIHISGFTLEEKLIVLKTTKLDLPKSELSLIKSLEIILVLLDVVSENKNDLNFTVNNVTFAEFIRNILKQLLFLNAPSTTSYKIFLKTVAIDPLSIEPIIDDIIIYTMIMDKHKHSEYYELFIINIFDIYSKLRRIENFISKMVHTLNNYFNGERKILEQVYKFNGKIDTEEIIMEGENIKVDDIFTQKILQHFCRCICNLASWQIINVFKTLLYQLRQTLNNINRSDHMENFMEIMSVLLSTFLCSIRIAEHTVGTNVMEKLLKELEELRSILQQFGLMLLNREHNQKLMRSFLNISYNWAEVYMSLEYYSINNEVQLNKSIDNHLAACNITYLHSYLTVKQWCLISERITNFGEIACKQLLEKLYIQKLRAMLLSDNSVNEDIVQNVVKSISTNIDIMWKHILEDKFVINNLLSKMEPSYALFLAEKMICDTDTFGTVHKSHITSSSFLIMAVNYVVITKINKSLTKRKDNLNSEFLKKSVSIRISSMFTEDTFLTHESKEIIETVKSLYSLNQDHQIEWNINEEKVYPFFHILEKFPVIFCSEIVQKLFLIYFFALHMDLSFEFKKGHYKKLQIDCERLILGVLQHCTFKITDLFTIEDLCNDIVQNYDQWECIFYIITENVFKDEYSIETYEPIIMNFTEKLLIPVYMRCCIVIANLANKMRKTKMSKNIKNTLEKYKSIICYKILGVVLQNKPLAVLLDGYCLALKHFLFNNEEERLSELLMSLNSYVDLALKDEEYPESNLMLLITVLDNKVKMQAVIGDGFSLKIWNAYKEKEWIYSRTDKVPQLVKLIFGQASNDEFTIITADLLNITVESVSNNDYETFAKNITIWEAILSCDLNPIKIKKIQSILEKLLQKFTILPQQSLIYQNVYKCMFNLQKTIVLTVHMPLTSSIADMILLSITLLYGNHWEDKSIYNLSITLLEALLKYRKPLVMDRLPCFLQIYRMLLKNVCERSNANLNLEGSTIKKVSDDSHQLEKLTKNLIINQKDMARIAMYLIADTLQHYEQINLHPNVKIHLNNCVYSLLSICDQHAIAFLMRALSNASTELFKDMYDSYKKFYRFTGKV